MRRTSSVLGAALATLALAATPAWAATPAQSTDDSTGAAQVGPVGVNAPVRVLSKGDDEPAGGGGPRSGGSSGGGLPPGDTPDEGPSEPPTGRTQLKSSGGQAPEAETEAAGGLASVGTPDGSGPSTPDGSGPSTPNGAGPLAAASAEHGELPFTGLAVWMLLVTGAFVLASGLRLQRRLMLEGRTRSL
jgi:hypothetical protein